MTLVIESTFIKSSKCSIPIWISWIFVVKFQLKNPNFLLVHLLSHTFFFCSRELRIQNNPPFSFQKICSDRALWQSLSSKKDHSNNTIRRTNIQDMAPTYFPFILFVANNRNPFSVSKHTFLRVFSSMHKTKLYFFLKYVFRLTKAYKLNDEFVTHNSSQMEPLLDLVESWFELTWSNQPIKYRIAFIYLAIRSLNHTNKKGFWSHLKFNLASSSVY